MRKTSDSGFTLIELLIVVAIISIIAAIAVPGLMRSRMTANETAAMTTLKHIATAQAQYSTQCGNGGFAPSLTVLGTPTPGTTESFVAADLGAADVVDKTGYRFTVAAGAAAAAGPVDCNGNATLTAYYASGIPITFGSTGSVSYAITAGNTIWRVNAPAAPTEPFGPPAVPVQ